jgi:hypothetical protein
MNLSIISINLCSYYLVCFIYFADKHVPGADGVMKLLRSLIELFTKSIQNVNELKRVQSYLNVYSDRRAVTVLQDVKTRWWSTFRMLKRLLHLRTALTVMSVNKWIPNGYMPSEGQWNVVEQIVVCLTTMAKFQCVLEAEQCVTASLVVLAVFQIRASYVKVAEDTNTLEPVRSLSKALLKDFDERFHPEDGGKVKYTGQADIGFHNRYTGVHPYFFIASMVDPRTKGMLTKMMTKGQYTKLKSDVVEFMFKAKKEMVKAKMTANVDAAVSSSTQSAERPRSTAIDAEEFEDDDDLFGGLEDNSTAEPELPPDEAEMRSQCEVELDHFFKRQGAADAQRK